MPARALLIEVRLLGDRYHGSGDWPPSPFRLFQALIAGAYGGRWKAESRADKDTVFKWLENLDPPHTVAPPRRLGLRTTYYVPNNDLDSKGGNPRSAAELRVAKEVAPSLIEGEAHFLYAWPFDEGAEHASAICDYTERLHTLGCGIDPAFALAKVVTWREAEERLSSHRGVVGRPMPGRGHPDSDPTCPVRGSLNSLAVRHDGLGNRFEAAGRDMLFRQPPKAELKTVSYNRPPTRFLFELRSANGAFRPTPQRAVSELTAIVRHHTLARLRNAMPSRETELRAALEGGLSVAEWSRRIRVVPLPTIGHPHASGAVRRLLVEVPPDCPVSPSDVEWAVSGQQLDGLTQVDEETGEVRTTQLVPSEDDGMLRHYGIDRPSRRFRTVTPVALELECPKGRLGGEERARFGAAAAREIAGWAREAGLPTGGLIVHTQREPFHAKGLRADQFEAAARLGGALVHAELIFQERVSGPIVLGRGEYEGLGIFRAGEPMDWSPSGTQKRQDAKLQIDPATEEKSPVPHRTRRAELARFAVFDGPPITSTLHLAELMRSALMSKLGDRCPPEISGRDDAAPLRSTSEHAHAFFLPEDADGDGFIDHLLIYCATGFTRQSRQAMDVLSRLWTGGTGDLHGNREWRIALELFSRPADLRTSVLVGSSRQWISATPYMKPRYDRKAPRNSEERIESYKKQILSEWRVRFPGKLIPVVETLHPNEGPDTADSQQQGEFIRTRLGRGGHQPDRAGGFFKLTFSNPVQGPVALGKHAHFGMGLFQRARG